MQSRSALIARSGSEFDVGRLFAAAEPDFARYEVIDSYIGKLGSG